MDILDDMGVSKFSAKVFFKSELLPLTTHRDRERKRERDTYMF